MHDNPVLDLLLMDIKANMDVQIDEARKELEETQQINADINRKLGNYGDKWSEYETMTVASASQRLRRISERPLVDQLDDIMAEG